jgi:hypothetical protein
VAGRAGSQARRHEHDGARVCALQIVVWLFAEICRQICMLCERQLENVEKLEKHVRVSKLHLDKLAEEKAAIVATLTCAARIIPHLILQVFTNTQPGPSKSWRLTISTQPQHTATAPPNAGKRLVCPSASPRPGLTWYENPI